MASIALHAIRHEYRDGHPAVRDVDLRIGDGELLVLVGPSGCGKSTLLRIIAGLEAPTGGRVVIGDTDVTAVPPQGRDIAMVFQSYALYPHMTVRANLAYGLRVRRTEPRIVEDRIASVAAALGLEPFLDRRPMELSGGQRQRVALGRAMVRQPKAFLLDEPLSNLDPALRVQARAELLRLQRSLDATVVYVTHDQEEAMTLGHRVAVMRDGGVEQIAPPMDLYNRPLSRFVAQFIGSPPMNLLTPPVPGVQVPSHAQIGIRPHDIVVGDGPLRATADVVERRGHDAVVHFRAAGHHEPIVAVVAEPPAPGAELGLSFPGERVHLFDATSGVRLERA